LGSHDTPRFVTLKIEKAAAYEMSGNTPVRGPTPKPNKRNVLAPVLVPYLMLCRVVRTQNIYLWLFLFLEDSPFAMCRLHYRDDRIRPCCCQMCLGRRIDGKIKRAP
jgi:hypothetical protein